ncbi:unnamed protein product [Wickerhamomyces anomalus]
MMSIFELPQEVLLKIFVLLDFESIKTLYSIHQFERQLQGFATIVSDIDYDPSLFPKYCDYINIHRFSPELVRSEVVFFVIQDLANPSLVNKISQIQTTPTSFILHNNYIHVLNCPDDDRFGWGDDADLEMTAKEAYDFYYPLSGEWESILENSTELLQLAHSQKFLKSVEFPYIKRLTLDKVDINSVKLKTPSLKELTLRNCTSTDESPQFTFPLLSNLDLEGASKCLIEKLDFGAYPDEKLSIVYGEISLMRNLTIGKAKTVSITVDSDIFMREWTSFMDISLPNCMQLYLDGFQNIKSISAPLLSLLSIQHINDREFHLNNFAAKHLESLILRNLMIAHFSDTDFQKLEYLDIFECTMGSVTGCFPRAETVRVSSCFLDDCFKNLDTQNLTIFEISRCEFNTGDNTTVLPPALFPSLKILCIVQFPKDGHLNIQAPNLEELCLQDPLCPIEQLCNKFPKLQALSIAANSSTIMRNVTIHGIKKFELLSSALDPTFQLVDCSFPTLEQFKAIGPAGSFIIEPCEDILDFRAPNLKSYKSNNLRIDKLDLSKFSKLRELEIGGVIELILGEVSQNLVEFTLNGVSLKELQYSKDPENIVNFDRPAMYPTDLEPILVKFEGYASANKRS